MKLQGILIFSLVMVAVVILGITTMWLIIYTPVVRTLGLVGDNGVISTETLLNNVLPNENEVPSDELILRYYMKQRGDNMISEATIINALKKVDSLDNELVLWKAYTQNIMDVVAKRKKRLVPDSLIAVGRAIGSSDVSQKLLDSVLRERTLEPLNGLNRGIISVGGRKLYPPLKGKLIRRFSYEESHYNIIIEGGRSGVVTSTDEGTVISCEWTPNYAYIMQVQHKNNIVSIYKGIIRPTKEAGSKVSAREVIGYVQGSDIPEKIARMCTSNGTEGVCKLLFEIWENGSSVDPEKYIIF